MYIPNTRRETGASTLPGGIDFYQECLRWHLSLDITPREVHDKGLKEVARIQGLMEEVRTLIYNVRLNRQKAKLGHK